MAGFLAKERTVARPGFNRWLIPPCALATHLCIGQAYALSVFNLPLTRQLGVSAPATGDWKLTQLGWIFTIAIVVLGASAALFGKWVQREGPRKSGTVAAICWGLGFLVGALGIQLHQLWLVYLGYGVLGGCGLGIGYITPVSTLISWFPDRRGMSTGMAIMGFGGGALIASPLSDFLMRHFASATSTGVAADLGRARPRLPGVHAGRRLRLSRAGAGLAACGMDAAAREREARHPPQRHAVRRHPHAAVLAPVGRALPERHRRHRRPRPGLGDDPGGVQGADQRQRGRRLRRPAEPVQHAGAVLLGVALRQDRSQADLHACFFALGTALYALVPLSGRIGSAALFVACFCLIITMYGGGFATVPAYLADVFGTKYVSAVHGRLLTAWSAAGIFGPVLVNYIRQFQIDHGIPKNEAYNITMYVMAGLLVIGFFANLAVRPVADRYFERTEAVGGLGPRHATV